MAKSMKQNKMKDRIDSDMKILLIDIETAPSLVYCWGLFKQNISLSQIVKPGYTLCYSAKWLGDDHVIFDSIHDSTKKSMTKGVWELLNEADAVVHYNGRSFDIPTLNKDFVLLGLTPPEFYHQIDLLQVARSKFRFTSNKLDYVAQQLGCGGKVHHKGMALWTGCMEGDEASWDEMREYNIQDTALLEDLYLKLLPWIANHPSHAMYSDEERPQCTNCGSTRVKKQGFETTKTMRYQRYRCKNCGTPLRGRTAEKAQRPEFVQGRV